MQKAELCESPIATVVVPVHNGAATLDGCLQGLQEQTMPELEIIVVDDGSTDDSSERARRRGVKVLRGPRRGAAAARNRGISESRASVVLFTDADCRPEPGWAARLLVPFADGRVAAAKGTYTSQQRSLVARFVQLEYEDRYRHAARFQSIDFIDTYAAAYRRSVLQDVGGFDERFLGASVEDQELSFRVAEAGHRMLFVPEARVQHQHPDNVLTYARRKFRIGYEKPSVHQRHGRQLLRDSHTPSVIRLQTLGAILWLAMVPWSFRFAAVRRHMMFLLAGVAVSATPFARRNLRRDARAGLITPALVLIRSLALGSGVICGAIRLIRATK